jgi:long-subunit acyl-CoA synthetase (AMP-forming)
LKNISTAILPFDLSGKDNRQYPAAVGFSSGTSGKPKGVYLTHHNMLAYAMNNRAAGPESSHSGMRQVFYALCKTSPLISAT